MTSDRRQPILGIVWMLTYPLAVLALGAGPRADTPDASASTPMEQALMERRCNVGRRPGAPETDAFQECLNAQLLSLRTDFGRDLVRLAEAERKTIDAACRRIRETRGRDAYMDCLSGQLVTIHDRLSRLNTASPTEVIFQSPPSAASSDGPASMAPGPLWASGTVIGGAVATLFVVGGGALVLMRTRRPRRKCRACGMEISEAGDLCQKCRHDAADALRQAAAQRADVQRAEEAQERRLHEQEEEQRGAKARQLQDDEARLQQEQARREDEARREEDVRQREEAARLQRDASLASGEGYDPYAVLGVSREASQEEILAAYQQAKLKYDAVQVDHLGADIREHYKTKAEAVERAYQQITG